MSFVTTITDYYLKIRDLPDYLIKDLDLEMDEVKANHIVSVWGAGLRVHRTVDDWLAITRKFSINLQASIDKIVEFTKAPIKSNIGFTLHRIANAGQVVGDIRFYDKVLNETDYDATITPFGYGKWRELVTGDYIYEKALCKYSMQASLNADRPNTRTYIHKVDVPDVVDRGIATLTKSNQPLFVRFSEEDVRNFHIIPELTVSIKSYSGTGTTPLIIPYNVTREGFYVTMKADGEFVEGSISWSARGY
jgi:hypothetical protein